MTESVIDITQNENNIRELQTLLAGLHHMIPVLPQVAVTGVWNDQTENAVRAFQKYKNLPETGKVDLETWSAIITTYEEQNMLYIPGAPLFPLYNTALVSAPENVPHFVEMLQMMLRTIAEISGFYPTIQITGRYDEQTASAISVVQLLSGLPTTGRLDPATWNAAAGMYNQEVRKLQASPPVKNP
ncbi:MAG: peptidoglycan-binding protein [Eubacteriales bacterium]